MQRDNHLPLLPIDICVPVQEFRADYTIVQSNKLPFVREFILRLLDLSNFTKDQLGKFMGFTEKEIEVALAQLLNLDEVTVNSQGYFQLTQKSQGYFSAQRENRPKIQSLEELRKGFRFDLLTFGYVKKAEILGDANSSIRLYPPAEAISTSAKSAKSAFQRYFHQIHDEENFGYLEMDNPELYKISSFKKQSEKYQRFSQIYGADIERNSIEPLLTHDFLAKDEVVTMLSEYLRGQRPANNVESVAVVFDSFEYEYGVASLKRGYVDIADYSIESRKLQSSAVKFKPVIGSILLEDNWVRLTDVIDMSKRGLSKGEKIELKWIAPSDQYWGKTEVLNRCFSSLLSRGDLELQIHLPIPHRKDVKTSKAFLKQFNVARNNLYGFIEGFMTGAEEVIIVNGSVAFVFSYLYQNEETLPTPIGFMTSDKGKVNSLISSFDSYLSELDLEFESRDLGKL